MCIFWHITIFILNLRFIGRVFFRKMISFKYAQFLPIPLCHKTLKNSAINPIIGTRYFQNQQYYFLFKENT